jgi:hypothetical protein
MRKYQRAVIRAKANKLSHYGKNGKSIKLFRMMWRGYQEATGKVPTAVQAAEKKKAKEKKRDKGILSRIANLRKPAVSL